jgi:heat shock protein HtpX
MWEAIARNRRKSRMLILLMGMIFVALGAGIGFYVEPNAGWTVGVMVASILWLVMIGVALYGGDSLLLASSGAREITDKSQMPQLWNVVEEMIIAAGLPKMPRLYVIDEDSPNAFAVGRNPQNAAVAVTSGLLKSLDRNEVQGVIAHELGHVANLDIRFMTIAAVMVGAAALISEVFLRSMRFGAGSSRRRRDNDSGGGQAQLILMVIVIVFAILAPIALRLLYLACSREREYLADASAARYTRYPQGLASALSKIALGARGFVPPAKTVAPMYIVNPLQAEGKSGDLFSTHPPTEERIRILLSMGGGAGLRDYERAFESVTGRRCMQESTLATDTPVAALGAETPAMAASPEPRAATIERLQGVNDLLGGLDGLLSIACACGVRIKVPPHYSDPTIRCIRCGRVHSLSGKSDERGTLPS